MNIGKLLPAAAVCLALCGCSGENVKQVASETDASISEVQTAETADKMTDTEQTTTVTTAVTTSETTSETTVTVFETSETESIPTAAETETVTMMTSLFEESETAVTTTAAVTEEQKSYLLTSSAYTMPQNADYSNTDFSFFDDCLFIGDSVCSGLKFHRSLLDVPQVAAKGNVGSWSIDEYTFQYEYSLKELDCFSIAKLRQPKRIFLWLGMNDLFMCTVETREQNLLYIYDRLRECCPDSEIYLVSITPLTSDHKWAINSDGNNRINKYNLAAKELCDNTEGFDFINVHDVLLDGSSMNKRYSSSDGMHLDEIAYKVILNEIIAVIAQKENAAAETSEAVTTAVTEETEAAETVVTNVTTVTTVTTIQEETEAESTVTSLSEETETEKTEETAVSEETTVSTVPDEPILTDPSPFTRETKSFWLK